MSDALDNARAELAQYRQDHPDPDGMCDGECGIALSATLEALIAEYERLLAARDEVQEKIAYLRRNCMGIPEQKLRQKISAVGEAEWKLGYYWNTLVAEHRDRATRAEHAQREAEREVERLTAPPADDEREALSVHLAGWDSGEAFLTAEDAERDGQNMVWWRAVANSALVWFRRQGPMTEGYGEFSVRDVLTGAVYRQPNKLIAERAAEMHGNSEVIPG